MTEWNYERAFSRNLGLVSEPEQIKIRNSRIAIAGMGGVGGVHLVTLLRMGFSRFSIADFDTYDLHNFNRQFGATAATLGKSKVHVMAEIARQINPEVDLRILSGPVNDGNVKEFLRDCAAYVDGIDAFVIAARRLCFAEARTNRIPCVTAGPMGFSTSWLVFTPYSMRFDDYFGFNDNQAESEQVIRFLVGLSPRSLHRPYIDLKHVNLNEHRGPSSMLACQLSSGVMAAEVLKLVLDRGCIRPAPAYRQFDAYRSKFASGYVIGGASNPLFKLKVWILTQLLNRNQKGDSQ